MAKVTKKVLGAARGKVADVVFAKWMGIDTARSYQPFVANPRTAAQQEQRGIIAKLSELGKGLSPAVNLGLGKEAKSRNMSARNLFSKLNYAAIKASHPATDYTGLVVSRGSMFQPQLQSPFFDTPLDVEVSWDKNQFPADVNMSTSHMKVAVFNPSENATVVAEFTWADGTGHVTVPSGWNGVTVYVYAFAEYGGDDNPSYGLKTGDLSASSYVGSGTIS